MFTDCLIAVIRMILMLFHIIMNVRTRRQASFNQTQHLDPKTRNLQKQIFILLMNRLGILLSLLY